VDRPWDGAGRCRCRHLVSSSARVPEDEHGEEVIRIISAREAEKRDIRRYEAQALDQE